MADGAGEEDTKMNKEICRLDDKSVVCTLSELRIQAQREKDFYHRVYLRDVVSAVESGNVEKLSQLGWELKFHQYEETSFEDGFSDGLLNCGGM